jgi:diketogulonate reductase-like aldo/keto reductase
MSKASSPLRKLELPNGESVPALGQGTWHMAEDPSRREGELAALQLGLDLGMTMIDTAEMYAEGAAEELVGQAIEGRRDEVFLVSKVLPHHATRSGTIEACEQSLRRLRTDRLDLYLLHWRGDIPLEETLDGFDELMQDDKIRSFGVSNFDVADMKELLGKADKGAVQTDQVLYNLTRRGIELTLMPFCRELRIPITAYSPIEQGRVLENPTLRRVAARHGATTAQVALAFVLRQDVFAIPKAGSSAHVRENRAAADLQLSEEDLATLDRAFPRPRHPVPLEML